MKKKTIKRGGMGLFNFFSKKKLKVIEKSEELNTLMDNVIHNIDKITINLKKLYKIILDEPEEHIVTLVL